MKKAIVIIVWLSLVSAVEHTWAQGCCTAGTSALGGVERGITPYRTLISSLSYQSNSLEDAYESTRSITDPLGRTASVEVLSLELEYGLADRVSVAVIGSYFSKTRETTVKSSSGSFSETASFKGSGLGDIIVLGKYQIVAPTITSPWEFSMGAGAKLPVGRYLQDRNGTRLSIDLQAGNGAADLLGWGFVLKSLPNLGLRFFGSTLYRYAGMNFDGYRFGDEFLVTIGSEYSVLEYLDLSLLLKGRFAQQDFSNGRMLQSTGGQMYSAVPNFVYREGNSIFRAFLQLPVYRNVNGIQLTLTRLVGLELQYFFDFRNNTISSNSNKEGL